MDYVDPESDPLTSVTPAVDDIDRTVVIDTDDIIQTSGLQTQGTEPTPALITAVIITVPSPIPTSAEPRTTRQRSR